MTVCIRGNVKLRIPAGEEMWSAASQSTEYLGLLTESVVDADSPGHSLLTLDRWKHLCRVLEGYRAFAQGVANREEVDESGCTSQSAAMVLAQVSQRTYKTTGPICDAALPVLFSRERPAANKKIHISGKVCGEGTDVSLLCGKRSCFGGNSQPRSAFFGLWCR